MEVRNQVGTGGDQAGEKIICLGWGPIEFLVTLRCQERYPGPTGPLGLGRRDRFGGYRHMNWNEAAPSAPRPGGASLWCPLVPHSCTFLHFPPTPFLSHGSCTAAGSYMHLALGTRSVVASDFSNLLMTSGMLRRPWKDSQWAQRFKCRHLEERWSQRKHSPGERSP